MALLRQPHVPCARGKQSDYAMPDPIEINRRNWDERVAIHARDATGDYMLDRFRAGEELLDRVC